MQLRSTPHLGAPRLCPWSLSALGRLPSRGLRTTAAASFRRPAVYAVWRLHGSSSSSGSIKRASLQSARVYRSHAGADTADDGRDPPPNSQDLNLLRHRTGCQLEYLSCKSSNSRYRRPLSVCLRLLPASSLK